LLTGTRLKLVEINSKEVELTDEIKGESLNSVAKISFEVIENKKDLFKAKIYIESGFEPSAIFLMNFTFIVEHEITKKIPTKDLKKCLISLIEDTATEYSFYVSTISNLMFYRPFVFPPFFTKEELGNIIQIHE